MHKRLSDFFVRIHRLMFDRAYLNYAIQWDTTFHALRTVTIVALLSILVASGIRFHRVSENFGAQFVETFGVLVFSQGELKKGHEIARTVEPRNVANVLRLLLGIKVPLTNIPEVRLIYSLDPLAAPRASFDILTYEAIYTANMPNDSVQGKPQFSSTHLPWPKEFDGKLTQEFLTQAIFNNWPSVIITLYVILLFVSISLLFTYLLVLLLLVVIYSHSEETLRSWKVRIKLLLYLVLPYFILFPLFALTADGIGGVSNYALIASSIMMVRLYGFIKTPTSPENGTTNVE